MTSLWQDLRYGVRTLLKNPSFTSIAVLTLALGIGANAAIFSVVNGVMLRPLPFDRPERIVKVWGSSQRFNHVVASAPDLKDWREQNTVFTNIGAYLESSFNLRNRDDPERVSGALVSTDFFDVFGVAPQIGRAFVTGEDEAGRHRLAVLSDQLWRRKFAASTDVIGSSIEINGEKFSVIGVMPPDFQFPNRATELWTPMVIPQEMVAERGNHGYWTVARLKPETALAQAQEQMKAIAARLAQQYPDTNSGYTVNVEQLQKYQVARLKPALLILSGAVAFVLFIACLNVANLMLARAFSRRRENALRAALGARRSRMIRQYLTESLLLSLTGGVAGLVTAYWGIDALILLAGDLLPPATNVSLDMRVTAFTLLVSILTGILSGLIPAWQATKADLVMDLKEGGGAGDGPHRQWLRSALVIAEISCALVLLVGAGLLIKSFWRLQSVDSGLKTENVLTMQLSLSETKYDTPRKAAIFHQQMLERVSALPGVRSCGLVTLLPLQGWGINGGVEREGQEAAPNQRPQVSEFRAASPEYFDALGMRLIAGRVFDERDQETTEPVVIINQTLAERLFPEENPVGKRLRGGTEVWSVIVGVASNVKQAGLERNPLPETFFPIAQAWPGIIRDMSLVVKSAADPSSLTPAIRNAILSIDPAQPVFDVKTMDAVIAESVSDRRLNMLLLGVFALVALLLATVGIYGVMSYAVTQSTREIGIRMALGAQRWNVLKLVIGQGFVLTSMGVGLGVAGALGLTRLMESLLFGISPTDPATFVGISAMLAAAALIATYIPAHRATKVDPIVALRYE